MRVYEALDAQDQILTVNQLSTLGTANKIYSDKGFEYFDPENALTGYKHYPSLIELKRIADSVLAAYKKKRLLVRPLSP